MSSSFFHCVSGRLLLVKAVGCSGLVCMLMADVQRCRIVTTCRGTSALQPPLDGARPFIAFQHYHNRWSIWKRPTKELEPSDDSFRMAKNKHEPLKDLAGFVEPLYQLCKIKVKRIRTSIEYFSGIIMTWIVFLPWVLLKYKHDLEMIPFIFIYFLETTLAQIFISLIIFILDLFFKPFPCWHVPW